MRSPFPGMDPYLEGDFWRGFHTHLASFISKKINQQVAPKYVAVVEVHTSLEEINATTVKKVYPDVTIYPHRQSASLPHTTGSLVIPEAPITRTVVLDEPYKMRSVHIYRTETKELVTAIELLSPANKRGRDLHAYRRKRTKILQSETHLIEIDLLRGGKRPGEELEDVDKTDYMMVVNRATRHFYRNSEIWPISLNEQLPLIPVPLGDDDPDAVLDCQEIVERVYEDNYFYLTVDYSEPVPPPNLRPAMQAWWEQRRAEWMKTHEQ